MIDVENIGIEQEGDIIFTTVGKYKLFLKHGAKGQDAYMLYSHLMFTARLQKTNCIKANNQYLMNGLGWGKTKLRAAKELLVELQIIVYKQEHNPDGTFGKQYIEVKTTSKPVASEPAGGSPAGGCQPANALTTNINALTKKKREGKPSTTPTLEEVRAYIKTKGYNVDPDHFYEYFSEGSWIDSKGNKVKNWKQKVITWHNMAKTRAAPPKTYKQQLDELYPRSR